MIIHSRDNGDGSVAKGILEMFVTLGLTKHYVHRHCFIGNSHELEAWSSTLPSFSMSRLSVEDPQTRAALLLVDHKKLLLGTDSPYLLYQGDKECHGPCCVIKVAEDAASLLGIPLIELVRMSNRNISRLYGLSW